MMQQDPFDPSGRSRPETHITTGEAAAILGVSPKTVTRWAAAGRIRYLVTLGGHRRYSLQSVLDLRDARAATTGT